MKNETPNRWEDLSWRDATRAIFKLQRGVFDAELRGEKNTVRKLQQKIANSFFAKALAVRQVAQISSGRKTAGIDGVTSPTPAEKMRMAAGLTIHHRPSPVRRLMIPKPGKDEKRPLGIPNLIDRAHQALLVLVLEPQWEAEASRQAAPESGPRPFSNPALAGHCSSEIAFPCTFPKGNLTMAGQAVVLVPQREQ